MPTALRLLAISLGFLIAAMTLGSCSGGDDGRFAFRLAVVGLKDSDLVGGHYEVWAVINGSAQTAGKFVIKGTGQDAVVLNERRTLTYGTASSAEFGPSRTRLGTSFPFIIDASHLFVTLEPAGDRDRIPSCRVILAGVIADESAFLSPMGVGVDSSFPCASPDGSGGFRIGLPDLGMATGSFQMLSPTDDVSKRHAKRLCWCLVF